MADNSEPKPETQFPLVDTILADWRRQLGKDYDGYRNHICRVLNFCTAFHDCGEPGRQKLTIAACFHDLGIWSHNTLDYLQPSVVLAMEYLERQDLTEWSDEIRQMIDLHHCFCSVVGEYPLVEVFRKADWVDATLGWRRFGLSRKYVRSVQHAIPNAGFHRGLGRAFFRRLRTHPLSPLPMMKWRGQPVGPTHRPE